MLTKANLFILNLIEVFTIQTVAAENQKIKAVISQRSPFTVLPTNDATSAQNPEGLDILILNEFAKKHGLEIEYSISKKPLHQVFISNKLTTEFFNSSINT